MAAPHWALKAAAVAGASGVALGAFGAHAFKPQVGVVGGGVQGVAGMRGWGEGWRGGRLPVRVARPGRPRTAPGRATPTSLPPGPLNPPHPTPPTFSKNEAYRTVFDTANKYHLAHAALLAAAPLARRPSAVASLAAAGVALFSGSCYAVALMEDRKYGALAPVGGFCLIGAWLALAL